MSNMKTLMDAGAYSVAGSLVLDNVELGRLRDGDLDLTDAGRDKLKELAGGAPAKKPAAKKSTAKSAPKGKAAEPESPPEEEQAPGEQDEGQLDDMGDLSDLTV